MQCRWLRALAPWVVIGLSAAVLGLVQGCSPVISNALVDADGQPIRLDAILEITTDSTLTEDQQRQELRELGITDPDVIEALVRNL